MKKLNSPFVLIGLTILIIAILSFLGFFLISNLNRNGLNINNLIETNDNSPELTEDDINGIFYAQITDLSNGTITIIPGTVNGSTFTPGDEEAWLTVNNDLANGLETGNIIKYTTNGASLITVEKLDNIHPIPKSSTGI